MGDIGSIPCVSVLQNGLVTLDTFKNYLMLSMKNYIILELNNMSSPYILSIKAFSLLKEVCINCCGLTTPFLQGKEGSLKRKRIQIQVYVSVLQNGWVTQERNSNPNICQCLTKWMGDIGFIPCVSVLQNRWVTLGQFHVLVFYKMDGRHWVP